MRGSRARQLRREYQPPGRGREIRYRELESTWAKFQQYAAVALPETRGLYQSAKRAWNRLPRPQRHPRRASS